MKLPLSLQIRKSAQVKCQVKQGRYGCREQRWEQVLMLLAEQAEQWLNTWAEIKALYLQGKFPDVANKSCCVIMWLLALATVFHFSINTITEQRAESCSVPSTDPVISKKEKTASGS